MPESLDHGRVRAAVCGTRRRTVDCRGRLGDVGCRNATPSKLESQMHIAFTRSALDCAAFAAHRLPCCARRHRRRSYYIN
ncbi:hypothetical protein PsYK624_171690 [Phanerochaete sordida]|uniref:Uncharacterized protein n=1 Tax=Phanerochaete sordida TaxID=48140 RepID=A0A9P3GT48_9APHY|nr:hypothetical protein PsYK624_171690 [Phanerochaete sordida]